jgi:hypothetical protein
MAIRSLVKRVLLTILLLFVSTLAALAIQPTTLQNLTKDSQCIVLGTVTKIRLFGGVHIAEVRVIQTLKGGKGSKVYFLAQRASSDDITEASPGTAYILFLRPLKISALADSSLQMLGIKNREGFAQQLDAGYGDNIFTVGHGGRGQMPVVREPHASFVRVRTTEVLLPRSMKTGPDADHKAGIVTQRVSLPEIIGYLSGPPER